MREPYEPGSNYAKGTSYGKKGVLKGNPKGKLLHDVWRMPSINNMSKERVGYPTQKPLALLDRIVRASTNPGDVALDPFCGCATTCVAAHTLGREWIGIDVSPKAYQLVTDRLNDLTAQGKLTLPRGFKIHFRQDIPLRTDLAHIKPLTGKRKPKICFTDNKAGTAKPANTTSTSKNWK